MSERVSGLVEVLALALSRTRDAREHAPNCHDGEVCWYCTSDAAKMRDALQAHVDAEVAAALEGATDAECQAACRNEGGLAVSCDLRADHNGPHMDEREGWEWRA